MITDRVHLTIPKIYILRPIIMVRVQNTGRTASCSPRSQTVGARAEPFFGEAIWRNLISNFRRPRTFFIRLFSMQFRNSIECIITGKSIPTNQLLQHQTMSIQTETKLSATIELTRWAASIMAASTYRFLSDNVDTNKVVLGALVLTLVLTFCMGAFANYILMTNFFTKNVTLESAEIPDASSKAAKIIDSKDADDDFPAINLVSTEDSEDSIEEEQEDWKKTSSIQPITAKATIPVVHIDSDDTSADSDTEEDDANDWNEEEYNRRHTVSKPVRVARPIRKVTQTVEKRSVTRTANLPKATTKSLPKKETLAQMRKRVAREMKESEERRRIQLGVRSTRSTSTRKPVRKETASEMKARVAREFAAKLKKK